jgi:hypothetical protein
MIVVSEGNGVVAIVRKRVRLDIAPWFIEVNIRHEHVVSAVAHNMDATITANMDPAPMRAGHAK